MDISIEELIDIGVELVVVVIVIASIFSFFNGLRGTDPDNPNLYVNNRLTYSLEPGKVVKNGD